MAAYARLRRLTAARQDGVRRLVILMPIDEMRF